MISHCFRKRSESHVFVREEVKFLMGPTKLAQLAGPKLRMRRFLVERIPDMNISHRNTFF